MRLLVAYCVRLAAHHWRSLSPKYIALSSIFLLLLSPYVFFVLFFVFSYHFFFCGGGVVVQPRPLGESSARQQTQQECTQHARHEVKTPLGCWGLFCFVFSAAILTASIVLASAQSKKSTVKRPNLSCLFFVYYYFKLIGEEGGLLQDDWSFKKRVLAPLDRAHE